MDAILQAIHKKDKAKLASLLEDDSNKALINNKVCRAVELFVIHYSFLSLYVFSVS
jgi:hypothetical protein